MQPAVGTLPSERIRMFHGFLNGYQFSLEFISVKNMFWIINYIIYYID